MKYYTYATVTIIGSIKSNTIQYRVLLYHTVYYYGILCANVNTMCYCILPYITILLLLGILTVKSNSVVDFILLKMLFLSFSISDNYFVMGSTNDQLFRHYRMNILQQNEYYLTNYNLHKIPITSTFIKLTPYCFRIIL